MARVLLPWLNSVSEKHPIIYCGDKYIAMHIHISVAPVLSTGTKIIPVPALFLVPVLELKLKQ